MSKLWYPPLRPQQGMTINRKRAKELFKAMNKAKEDIRVLDEESKIDYQQLDKPMDI